MTVYRGWTAVQPMFALAVPIVAGVWLLTAPGVAAVSSFFAAVVLLTAFAWVVRTTYANSQAAGSLAPSLHDPRQVHSRKRR